MAVYVDALVHQPSSPLGARRWCHMIADTLEELHAMAARVGMKRAWFQRGHNPHYDLVESRRQRAVAAGAVECDRAAFVGHLRRVRGAIAAARVLVSFACNDSRNGLITDRVENVHLDNVGLELYGPAATYREERDWLRIGRRRFEHRGITEWFGNWCWNAAQMDDDEARRLVLYLLELGWRPEAQPEDGPWAALVASHGA